MRAGSTEAASSLVTSLLIAGHHAARALEARLGGEVSAGEAVLLAALSREPLTMTGVMSALHIKASTATSLVSRLESDGYVERARRPSDRRSFLVSLTPEGRALWRSLEPVFASVDDALSTAAGSKAAEGYRKVIAAIAALDESTA
jgi:DNA-binding MarR family transcriptional regulator